MPNAHKNKEIKICRMTRTILQYSFLWPGDGTELNPGVTYKLKVLCFFLITGGLVSSLTIYFILAVKNHEDVNAEHIALLAAVYGTYYMVCAYVKNQNKLALLLRDLSNFENFGVPPGFEKRDRQLNNCSNFMTVYSFIGSSFYNFIKFLEKPECKKFHAERGTNGNYCGLVATFWIPFETDYFPVFQILLLYVVFGGHLVIKMALHISFNALEIAHHIILRISHLKMMITECFDDENYEISRAKLTKCILYHCEILNCAARLDETFFNTMFAHFCLTGIICACLEKQIVDGINVAAGVLHIFGWIIALFVGCVGGQHLLNASETVPNAIWASKWYQADLRLRKDVLLMLMRSQQDFYIRAGPFGVLGYPLFVSVVKGSYSILAMLTS